MARPTDGKYGYFYARVECWQCKVRIAMVRRLYKRFKQERYRAQDCECGGALVLVPVGWKAYCAAMAGGMKVWSW